MSYAQSPSGFGSGASYSTINSPLPISQMNPNYQIHLWGTDENGGTVDLFAAMPETFSIDTTSTWQPILPGGNAFDIAGGVGATTGKSIQTFTGYSGIFQALTQQVWVSSSPVQLRLPFQFNCISNPVSEVIKPLVQLIKLSTPSASSGGGPLRAPGPSIVGKNSYNMTLKIGRNITFTNILVLNVYGSLESMVDQNGNFMSCTVDVEVSTNKVMTKTDIDTIFGLASSSTDNAQSFTSVVSSIPGQLQTATTTNGLAAAKSSGVGFLGGFK